MNDLQNELKKVDPKKKVEVGSYRLDADGNSKHNVVNVSGIITNILLHDGVRSCFFISCVIFLSLQIPYALSEMHISESLEKVCVGIDDYVRATRKDTGELILMKLIVDGKMNEEMSNVDIIQDGDLNKSLKYYVSSNMLS